MVDLGFEPQSVWWHVVSLDPDAPPFICFPPPQHILFLLLSLSHGHAYLRYEDAVYTVWTCGSLKRFLLGGYRQYSNNWDQHSFWDWTLNAPNFSAPYMQRKIGWGLNVFCSTRKQSFSSYQTFNFLHWKGNIYDIKVNIFSPYFTSNAEEPWTVLLKTSKKSQRHDTTVQFSNSKLDGMIHRRVVSNSNTLWEKEKV